MADNGIHCDLCNHFFHKHNEYIKHCEGKKHKAKEILAREHDLADRRLFVRGIDWMRDPEAFLYSYFYNFGKLNNISFGGKQGSMYAIVEFQDQDSIARTLNVKHKIERHMLTVRRYKYQPQHWERNKLTNEEFVEEEKAKQTQVRDKMLELLLTADSLMDQINLVDENLKLDPADQKARVQICEELTELFAPHFEDCRVFQFGSSVNGFGAKGCDLDLFLDIDDETSSAKSKIKKLSQILLKSPNVAKTLIIPSNRCPVVRFLHKSSNIKCDLSINNRKALHNSYLLRLYSTDHRVHKLVSIVRLWARSQGLTSATGGAHLFTSYAITLIVLYFLMHREKKIIPLVCDIETCVEGTRKEVGENSESLCIPSDADLPPSDNTDNEVDLVKEFFAFCSESINWDTDALYMKDATAFPRSQISQDPRFIGCKASCMTVIDPFVLTHNVVANINDWTKCKFVTELKRAAELTRDWPTSVQKLESGPWGIAELLLPNPDQTASKPRKNAGHPLAGTAKAGRGKGQDAAGKVILAGKSNASRVEGEQENGEFCITVQPVSDSLTCTRLLLTAKQNNVTPAEQWCNMAQQLILNVLKTVFMVEVVEVDLSEQERTEKLGQGVDSSRGSEVKAQKDSEVKDQRDATGREDGRDDYVLVDVSDNDDDGQMSDEASGCKRSRDAARLDGLAVAADSPATYNASVDVKVGNAKKFCEGIANSVDHFEEVIVVNASTEGCSCKGDANDSSNACTDDYCMEIISDDKTGLERQDASPVPRSNQDIGGPSAIVIPDASGDVSTKELPSQQQTPISSSELPEVRPSKVFSYACSCSHQVWVDRKKAYLQVPHKETLSALALEQEVTKLVLVRRDLLLQKIDATSQGELKKSKSDKGHKRSPAGQNLQGQVHVKGQVKGENLKHEKIDSSIPPSEQNTVSSIQTDTSKEIRQTDVDFLCQILYQNCDVDCKLPYILIKLKPSLSTSKQFRNFFSAFRSQILRLITLHFLEMSS